jgi:hypothetical protein
MIVIVSHLIGSGSGSCLAIEQRGPKWMHPESRGQLDCYSRLGGSRRIA